VASSSCGRLFDAVAALLGLCLENRFEAEAPMALESAAAGADAARPADGDYELREPGGLLEIDLAPFVRKLAHRPEHGATVPELAATFHEVLAAAWEAAVVKVSQETGLHTIVLSGGVFCNERLSGLLDHRLQKLGLRVLRHRDLPPNDGGIAYGQAAVATARLALTKPRK
jgi:hydrogenase maturation protein HypF